MAWGGSGVFGLISLAPEPPDFYVEADVKRVLIIGGGISGLIANYVFKQYRGVEVKVMEPGQPGGEFASGGLKYLHRTDEIVAMMSDLGVVFSNHSIRGGILLHGNVEAYPRILTEMPKERADRIRLDHYRKTRRQEPGEFGSRAMNDPEDVGVRKALSCDIQELIRRLSGEVTFIKARLDRINDKFVTTTGGGSHWFDFLVLTIPLWVIKQSANFNVPEGHAMRLNVATVEVVKDRYAKWDYVYTPYTPSDAIHRVSSVGGGYQCEINGEFEQLKLVSDLNFIFKDGWVLSSVKEGLKGHLLPLSERPIWPEHVAPIGRFAKWDPRSTADVVADDARELAESWGWQIV